MALTFRLYTYGLTYAGSTASPSLSNIIEPEVLNLGDIEEALELEDGGFRLGNVTATVRGVPEDYFRGASNINAPVVFEIADGGAAIWHGPVQASSVDYDQGKFLTTFTARSWEAVMAEATAMPARSVYETETKLVGLGGVQIPLLPRLAVYFPYGTPVQVGDTLVVDGPVGEVRETVLAVSDPGGGIYGSRVAEINQPPEVYPVRGQVRTGRHNNGNVAQIDFSVENSEIVRGSLPENSTAYDNPAWRRQSAENADLLLYNAGGGLVKAARVQIVEYRTADSGTMQARFFTVPGSVTLAEWNQTARVDLRVQAPVRAGANVRILGRDFYGYVPSGLHTEPSIETVIEAMLFVGENNRPNVGEGRPLGVLPNVIRYVDWLGFPGAFPTIPRGTELPDRPIEALRLLQNTGGFFVRFVPGFRYDNGETYPVVDVQLISRSMVENGTPVQAPESVIRSWTEKAVVEPVRAVVVRANEDYNKPKTSLDYAGIWFTDEAGRTPDEIAAVTADTNGNGIPDGLDRLRYLSVPTGPGVIEVEVAATPAYAGAYSFGGGDPVTVNDDRLKQRAKTLWSYYSAGGRRFNARLAYGHNGFNPVGQHVSFDEADFKATVFVTKRTVSVKEGALDTQIEGIIEPRYIVGTPLPPVATISGSLAVNDPNGDGQAEVVLSGARSYSPTSGTMTYAWERRSLGGTFAPVGNGITLTDTVSVLPGTTAVYEYRLTVTADGLTGTDIERVVVSEAPAAQPLPDPRAYTDIQFLSGADGVAKLYLARPDAVSKVYFRTAEGAELDEIVWSNPPNPALYYPTVRFSADGTDNQGAFWTTSVPLSTLHLSYIEAYVEFDPDLGVEPLIVRWSFDADTLARLRDVSFYTDGSGGVYVSVRADEDTVQLNIQSYEGGYDTLPGNSLDNYPVYFGSPGDTTDVTVTPYALVNGAMTAGEAWTRYYTIPLTTAPSTTGGSYFTFYPSETNLGIADVGTVIFDQDSGDGAGNRQGLQVRYPTGYATVWDKTNDGAGSGLDADLLDGYEGVAFPRKAEAAVIAGRWAFEAGLTVGGAFASAHLLSFGTTLFQSGKKLALYENGGDLYGFGVTGSSVDFYASGLHTASFSSGKGFSAKQATIGSAYLFTTSQGTPPPVDGLLVQGNVTGPGNSLNILGALQYDASVGDKLRFYGNNYGIGVEANNLTAWAAGNHRWRIGGGDVAGGFEAMQLNASYLRVPTRVLVGTSTDTGYTMQVNGSSRMTTGYVDGILSVGAGTAGNGTGITFYSAGYGIGIENEGSVTAWSVVKHRWRIGGSGVAQGTEAMVVDATGLGVVESFYVGQRVGIGAAPPSAVSGLRADINGFVRMNGLYTNSSGAVQIGSESFVGGFGGNGYRIGRYGAADGSTRYSVEADSLTIRGTFNVYEIIAREISAVNGNLFISAQNEVATFSQSYEPTRFDVASKGPVKLTAGSFVIGQMLSPNYTSSNMCRAYISDVFPTFFVAYVIEGALALGMTLARYDHASDPGQRGYIYMATSDTPGGAPYQAIRYGDGTGQWPPAGGTEIMRSGRLTGLNGIADTVFGSGNAASSYGMAAGNIGQGGWISVTGGTGGVQFWQGIERLGYINSAGFWIGDTPNHIAFNAQAQTFDLKLGGREVITASTVSGITTLRLGGNGITNLVLAASQIDAQGLLTVTSSAMPNDANLHTHVTFNGLAGSSPVNTSVVMGRGTNGVVERAALESTTVGVVGRAARFTGASRVALTTPVNSPSYSIALWYKRDAGVTQTYKTLASSNSATETHHIILMNEVLGTYCNGFTPLTVTTPTGTAWHHIALTVSFAGGTRVGRWYIDGVEKANFINAPDATLYPITHIGNHGSFNAYPAGPLDEVRIYTEELTAQQVRALYLSPGGTGQTQIDGALVRVGTGVLIDGNTGRIQANLIDANTVLAQQITVEGGYGYIYLNPEGALFGSVALAIGNDSYDSCAFQVTYAGYLYASGAFIQGTVYSDQGVISSTLQLGSATPTTGAGLYATSTVFNLSTGTSYIRSNGSALSIVTTDLTLTANGSGAANSMGLNNTRLAFGVATSTGYGGAGEGVFLGIDGGLGKLRLGQAFKYDGAGGLVVGPMGVNADRMVLNVQGVELQFGKINPGYTTRDFVNDGSASTGIRFWDVTGGVEMGYIYTDMSNFGSLTFKSKNGLTGNACLLNASGITFRGKTQNIYEHFTDFDLQFDGGQPYFWVRRVTIATGFTQSYKFRAVA